MAENKDHLHHIEPNHGADWKPFGAPRHLRFWSQKVLPAVYDNSLSYYEVLTKLNHSYNEMISVIDDMLGQMEWLTEEIQKYVDFTEQMQQILDELAEIRETLTTIRADISALQASIASLTSRMDAAERDIDLLQLDNASLHNDIAALHNELSALHNELAGLGLQIAALQQQYAALHNEISALELEFRAHLKDYDQIYNTVVSLQQDIAKLTPAVENLQQNVQYILDVLAGLDERFVSRQEFDALVQLIAYIQEQLNDLLDTIVNATITVTTNEGANVEVTGYQFSESKQASGGTAQFSIGRVGIYNIEATLTDYDPRMSSIAVTESTNYPVALPLTLSFRAFVTVNTGETGTIVTLTAPGYNQRLVTPASGAVTFTVNEPGSYTVTAQSSKYTGQTLTQVVNVQQAQQTYTVQIEFIPPFAATISVTAQNGASVNVVKSGVYNQTKTVAGGAAAVFDLTEAGSYVVTVTLAGYVTKTQTILVQDSKDYPVNMTLDPVFAATLTVTTTAGSTVTVTNASIGYTQTQTATNGTALFSMSTTGTYTVTCSRSGYITRSENVAMTASQAYSINLTLNPVFAATLTVTTNAGATVKVTNTSIGYNQTKTATNGSATFDMSTAGTYTVECSLSGYVTRSTTVNMTASQGYTASLTLSPVFSATLNVTTVQGATVTCVGSVSGTRQATATNGTATFSFSAAETVKVTAVIYGANSQTQNVNISASQTYTTNCPFATVQVQASGGSLSTVSVMQGGVALNAYNNVYYPTSVPATITVTGTSSAGTVVPATVSVTEYRLYTATVVIGNVLTFGNVNNNYASIGLRNGASNYNNLREFFGLEVGYFNFIAKQFTPASGNVLTANSIGYADPVLVIPRFYYVFKANANGTSFDLHVCRTKGVLAGLYGKEIDLFGSHDKLYVSIGLGTASRGAGTNRAILGQAATRFVNDINPDFTEPYPDRSLLGNFDQWRIFLLLFAIGKQSFSFTSAWSTASEGNSATNVSYTDFNSLFSNSREYPVPTAQLPSNDYLAQFLGMVWRGHPTIIGDELFVTGGDYNSSNKTVYGANVVDSGGNIKAKLTGMQATISQITIASIFNEDEANNFFSGSAAGSPISPSISLALGETNYVSSTQVKYKLRAGDFRQVSGYYYRSMLSAPWTFAYTWGYVRLFYWG